METESLAIPRDNRHSAGNLQLLIGSLPGFLPASSLQRVPPSPPPVLQPLSESCTHCLKDPAQELNGGEVLQWREEDG